MSKSFKNKDELAQWALQQYGGGSSSNGQSEQGAPQKNKDDFAQWALQQYGGTGNPSSGAGAPPSPQGEGFGQQESQKPRILKPSQMKQLQQQGRFTDTGTGDRFGRQGRNVTDPSTAARSPSPAGRGGFESGALGRQTQGLFDGLEKFGRSNLEKDSNAQGVLYEAAGGQIDRATASMQQAGEKLDKLNSAFNSSIKPYEQDLDARKQAYETAVAEMQAAADRGDVRAYQAALLRAEEASSAYDLAYSQYQNTWDNLYRAYKGAWDQASKEYEGASADYEKARQNASGAYENLRKNGVFEESEKEQQYGYDPEKARTNRDYYTAHIDAAIAQGDYAQASWWMDKLVSAPLGKEERDRAVRYIHEVYGNLEQLGSNEDAAKRLGEAYERDARAFAELITGDEGARLLSEVEEKYHIPKTLAFQDPDAYAAAVRNARGGDFAAASSDREWQAYNEFAGSKQYWLTQNAQNAFLKRAEDTMQRAEHNQMRSAQMDSYTRAQQAVFALDQLTDRLDIYGNQATYFFDNDGKLTDSTAKYLIDELKGYGVDLSGLNASNYRELVEQAYELSGSRVRMMGDALRSDGYDMFAVRKYLEYQRDLRIEEDRNKSAREWAKQQAEAAREFRERHRQEGADMLEPWDPAYAGTASFEINEGLWNQVIASLGTVAENSLLSVYQNIPTWARLLSGGGNVNNPNAYVPVAPQTKQSDLVRQAIGEQMSDAGQFWYNAVMSWADSTANAAMFGGVGFGGAPAMGILGETAGEIFTQAGTLATMGMNAATSQANEILKRGGSRSQAIAGGLAAGVVETLTEIYSVENLIHLSEGVGYKQLVKELLKSFVSEGSEEVAGNVLDKIIDKMNMGNLSENSVAVRDYIAQGYSEEEARKKVLIDNLRETLEAGLSGGLSGTFSTVAVGVPSAAVQEANARELEKTAFRGYASLAEGRDAKAAVKQYARDNGIDWDGKRPGTAVFEAAGSLQEKMQGKPVQEIQEIYEQTVEEYGDGIRDTAKLAAATALQEVMEEQTTVEGVKQTAEAMQTEITNPDLREAMVVAAIQRGGEIIRQQTGEDSSAIPQNDRTEERIATSPSAPRNDSEGEGFSGQAGLVPTAEQEGFGTGNPSATMNGGLTDGSTEGTYDSGQRDAGVGPAGQTGGLAGSPGGSVHQGADTQTDAGKKNAILALGNERTSAKEQGILNGTDQKTFQLITDRSLYDSGMEAADQIAQARGVQLQYVKGPIEVYNPYTKKTATVAGLRQDNPDGSVSLYARADQIGHSGGQVAMHELFHDLMNSRPDIRDRIVSYLFDNYTQKEIDRLLYDYSELYDGIYGDDEAADLRYLEEAFCDVYAGMQRGRIDPRIAQETLGVFQNQIDSAMTGGQTERATRETRGSPEQKFSMEETTDGRKVVVLDEDILDGIDLSIWNTDTKEKVKKAASTALKKFSPSIYIDKLSDVSKVNKKFRNEYTRSNYSEALSRKDPTAYQDKMRMASNADEVFGSVDTWNQDGYLKHPRKDDIVDFTHGTTLVQAGPAQYRVEAMIGITKTGELQTHDILDVTPTSFTLKSGTPTADSQNNPTHARQGNPASANSVSQPEQDVKRAEQKSDDGLGVNGPGLGRIGDGASFAVGDENEQPTAADNGLGVNGPGLGRVGESADAIYQAAVERGDLQTLERMVRDAAWKAGYNTPKLYRGVESFGHTRFKAKHIFTTTNENIAADYTRGGVGDVKEIIEATKNQSESGVYQLYGKAQRTLYLNGLGNQGGTIDGIKIPAELDAEEPLESIEQIADKAFENGYDCIVVIDFDDSMSGDIYYGGGDVYIFKNSNQVKSADPVTYDDDGNVIPLSKRFNENNQDIRYSMAEEEDSSAAPQNERTEDGDFWLDSGHGTGESQEKLMRDMDRRRFYAEQGKSRQGLSEREAAMEEAERRRQEGFDALMEQQAYEEAGMGQLWREYAEIAERDLQERQTKEDLERIEQNRKKRQEKARQKAEKKSVSALRQQIQEDKNNLEGLEYAKKLGESGEKTEQRIRELRETIEANEKILKEKQEGVRKAEKEEKQRQEAEAKPRIAQQEFKQGVMDLFSTQEGSKLYISNILDDFAERVIAKEVINHEDRIELMERLINNGAIEFSDPYKADIREAMRRRTVYVSPEVRAEFGGDWNAIRNRAFGIGLYIVTDSKQGASGIEAWNQELAEQFPGSFDAEDTDLARILEKMIDLGEEGKKEKVSLTEMMRRNEMEYGWSRDDQLEDFMDKLNALVDSFAGKAELEIKVETQNRKQRMEERQRFREMREMAADRKLDARMQEELLKRAKELRNLGKTQPNAVKAQIEELIGNLDLWARSISPQGLEDLTALKKQYEKYLGNKNNLRKAGIEKKLARLEETQISDMSPQEIANLTEAVVGMIKQIKDANRMLSDERGRTIHEDAKQLASEVKATKGSWWRLAEHVREWHLDARRFLEHITGYARGEGSRLANLTEDCARRDMHYRHSAEECLDSFLWKTENGKKVRNKENIQWLKKSMGKHAERIEIEVGVWNENGTISSQKVEITPMMRVALLMHSKNEQNLNHIKEGGLEIPELKRYLKGDLIGAYDKSKVVKIEPEAVREIVSHCTEQEKAFAKCLENYFKVSAGLINETSMVLEGYERAGIEHYFPIQVAQEFIESAENTFVYDATLDHMGPLHARESGATTPIVLADAYDVFDMHKECMSKYYGYAIFARDLQAVTDHVLHEEGYAYADSVEKIIKEKWGSDATNYIQKLLQDISNPKRENQNALTKAVARLRGMRARASLNGNFKVILSQFASLPYARAYLGKADLLYGMTHKADMEILNKYTDLDWYRRQGNSTMEVGELLKDHLPGDHIPVLTTGIQGMDSFTTRRIWEASVHWVEKNTNLKPGDRKAALEGNDEFWQRVARKYEETVFRTQPNYTTILRPDILRGQGEFMKSMTMFKTVPFQNNGMLQEAAERLRNDERRYKENKTKENKAYLKESRNFDARTRMGVLEGSILYVAMGAAALLGTFRGKRFKDDDGNINPESVLKGLGMNLLETYAGMWLFGGDLLSVAEKYYDAAKEGKTGYQSTSLLQSSVADAATDLEEACRKLLAGITSGDKYKFRKSLKEVAQELAMDALGFPAKNIETYLLAATKWISPDLAAKYASFFDEMDKKDLSAAELRDQKAILRILMDNRTEGISDETIEEIQKLWNAGCGNSVPNGIPTSISIDGEDFELSREKQEAYKERWSEIVSGALEELMDSDLYLDADEKERSKILSTLYEYASAVAKSEIAEGFEPDNWVQTGQKLAELGMSAKEYLEYYMQNKELSNAKEKMDALKESGWTEEQMETYWTERMSSDTELQKYEYLKGNGVGWLEAMDLLDIGENDSLKLNERQQAAYDAAWNRIVKSGIDDLYKTKGYMDADTDTKTAYLKKLFTYAGQAAKAEATGEYSPDKWVKTGLEAEKLGVSAAEYVVFNAELAKLDSKNEAGESEDGLLLHKKIELLRKTGWTDKQMESVFMGYIAEDAKQKEMKTMRDAGFTVKQALDVLTLYGEQEKWQKAQQVIKTGVSDEAKIKALEQYLGKQDYPAVKAGYTLHVDMDVWVQCMNSADANENGSITQEEIEKYLRTLDISTQEKAYIWQMISYSKWNSTKQYYPKTYQKNPFSKGFGEEIWHLIYG